MISLVWIQEKDKSGKVSWRTQNLVPETMGLRVYQIFTNGHTYDLYYEYNFEVWRYGACSTLLEAKNIALEHWRGEK